MPNGSVVIMIRKYGGRNGQFFATVRPKEFFDDQEGRGVDQLNTECFDTNSMGSPGQALERARVYCRAMGFRVQRIDKIDLSGSQRKGLR